MQWKGCKVTCWITVVGFPKALGCGRVLKGVWTVWCERWIDWGLYLGGIVSEYDNEDDWVYSVLNWGRLVTMLSERCGWYGALVRTDPSCGLSPVLYWPALCLCQFFGMEGLPLPISKIDFVGRIVLVLYRILLSQAKNFPNCLGPKPIFPNSWVLGQAFLLPIFIFWVCGRVWFWVTAQFPFLVRRIIWVEGTSLFSSRCHSPRAKAPCDILDVLAERVWPRDGLSPPQRVNFFPLPTMPGVYYRFEQRPSRCHRGKIVPCNISLEIRRRLV